MKHFPLCVVYPFDIVCISPKRKKKPRDPPEYFCFLKQSYRFNIFHFLRCFPSLRELEFNAYNDNGVYLCAPLCSKFRKAFNAFFFVVPKIELRKVWRVGWVFEIMLESSFSYG